MSFLLLKTAKLGLFSHPVQRLTSSTFLHHSIRSFSYCWNPLVAINNHLYKPFSTPFNNIWCRGFATKYKLKTKSSVKKRIRVKANGEIKRGKANKSHLATKKNRKRVRQLGVTGTLEGKIKKNILSMLH